MAEVLGDFDSLNLNAGSDSIGCENSILDSTDPYEKLNSLGNGRPSSENRDLNNRTEQETAGDDRQNGDVGLLEIAVEAQPDLIFESDLATANDAQMRPFVRPRVYLERESFNNQNEDSLSLTANNVN